MQKLMVKVPKGFTPIQVEFPEYKSDMRGRPDKSKPFGERSRKGALHLKSDASVVVTQDEFDYMVGSIPECKKLMVVAKISEEKLLKKQPVKQPVPEPEFLDSSFDLDFKAPKKKK